MLALNEDQLLFKDVVKRFFREKSPPDQVREHMVLANGYAEPLWQQMSSELGLTGLHIPEIYGGSGYSMVELGLVLEAMGQHLYCGPFFSSSVMSTFALLLIADETARKAWLPELASGSRRLTLVLDNLESPADWGSCIHVSDEMISGHAKIVLDAEAADGLLVVARNDKGERGLYLVQKTAEVNLTPHTTLDATRKLYAVTLNRAEAEYMGDMSSEAGNQLWNRLCLCLAHEMMGGAQYLLDSTVEYTKLRYQFGRPIGSFQALKHQCAELLMSLELARGVVAEATLGIDGAEEGCLASMAKAMASDAYMEIAKSAIQMRGGIGFTWENDTHLWFKRAKSSEVFLGSPGQHRERLISLIEESEYAA